MRATPAVNIPWEETEVAMFTFAFWSWMMDGHPTIFDDIVPNLYDIPGLAAFGEILATLPKCSSPWNTWPSSSLNQTFTRSTRKHVGVDRVTH
ncbi:MAG: hypothetical protein V3V82_00165 [Acidimicrobiia bacterium]